jgi:hypothetical protein
MAAAVGGEQWWLRSYACGPPPSLPSSMKAAVQMQARATED